MKKLIFIISIFFFVCFSAHADRIKVTGGGSGSGSSGVGVGTVNPGVIGAIPKYIASTTLDDSPVMFEGGSNIGIGTTGPTQKLQVSGTVLATAFSGNLTGNVTGNADTATALAANGANASAGNAILGVDASGAAEGAFDVWTEAENTAAAYATQVTTITIAGTANQITSSAGAQSLAANRTWTLSFPSNVGIGTATPSGIGLSVMSGNVGIGTWSPTSALQVIGTIGGTTVTGANVTSGADPGHTHTSTSISGIDISADTNLTAGDALTLTDDDIDFDGGTAPGGELGGTWGTPTIDDGVTVDSWALGASTATTINKVTITTPATGSTLTIADGKTLTVTNTANISTLTDGKYCKYTAAGTLIDCNSTCADITGSADLCDGSDDGGGGSGGWTDFGTDVALSSTSDLVGIGTTDPDGALEIIESGEAPFMVSLAPTGNGDLLIVNSIGNVGIGTISPVGGLIVMNGNVGVGTWSPVYKLQVAGTLDATTITQGGSAVGVSITGCNKLVVTSAAVTTVTITADNCVLLNGSTPKLYQTISETCTITTSGISGLEASDSEAANTIYEVFLKGKSDGTIDCLLNADGTAIGTLPSGYDYSMLISHVVNKDGASSNDFYPYVQYGNHVRIILEAIAEFRIVNGGTGTSWTNVDGTGFIPSTVRLIEIHFEGSGTDSLYAVETAEANSTYGMLLGRSSYVDKYFIISTDADQDIEYYRVTGTGSASIDVIGWFENF